MDMGIPPLPSLILSAILRYLLPTQSELFKCRLICKEWNHEAVKILIKRKYSTAYFTGKNYLENPALILNNYRKLCRKSPIKFESWIFAIPAFPVTGKCKLLSGISAKYKSAKFKREFRVFISQDYVERIQSLKIFINESPLRFDMIFNILQISCNTLRKLELVFNPLVCLNHSAEFPRERIKGFSYLKELALDFGPYPELSFYVDYPDWFNTFLKLASQNVESLVVIRGEVLITVIFDITISSFPNLTRLELGIRRYHPRLSGLLDFSGQLHVLIIRRVGTSTEKVYKGQLRSDCLNCAEYLSLLIEKHSETLTELTLALPNSCCYSIFTFSKCLPKLSALSVDFCQNSEIHFVQNESVLPELIEMSFQPCIDDVEELGNSWLKILDVIGILSQQAGTSAKLRALKIDALKLRGNYFVEVTSNTFDRFVETYLSAVDDVFESFEKSRDDWLTVVWQRFSITGRMGNIIRDKS